MLSVRVRCGCGFGGQREDGRWKAGVGRDENVRKWEMGRTWWAYGCEVYTIGELNEEGRSDADARMLGLCGLTAWVTADAGYGVLG